MSIIRKKTIGFCGGAFGDEGKGRIVDEYVNNFAKKGSVVVYRDNGGANAGHTIEFENGKRVALHLLPSGIFIKGATVVLGKGMVIHPGDLVEEISQVMKISSGKLRAKVLIDEMAALSLDTHRAFEAVLKDWEEGGKGSTGRGISPAYMDILLRQPLRMRDLATFNEKKIRQHYKLYEALVKGLGFELENVKVPWLKNGETGTVGSADIFVERLRSFAKILRPYTSDVFSLLKTAWADKKTAFVFEKAQAVGLDVRYGVYPDVTASDTTFDGILSSSEGAIDPDQIEVRAAVIKATYMSSVGSRKLPTLMNGELANKIREDAFEYGATTKRPRDIAYLDLPAIKFFAKSGQANALILTHMDVVYADTPIKICVGYTRNGRTAEYRPDQEYLDTVKPLYKELNPWDVTKLRAAKTRATLPNEAKQFLALIEKEIGVPIHMITTGPQRNQGILLSAK